MQSCSALSGKPDSNSLDCIVFSCFEVYRDWNRWNDEGFTFLESDVSWVYLLSQMLFWQLMYLHWPNIRCCRCSFGDQCIYKALIFIVADALFGINVSVTCFSSNLQILLSLPVMYNCIYILPFLGFKDTPFANFASTSHVFDNVRMLPIKILYLYPPKIHYRRYHLSISFVAIHFTTWANTLLTQKFTLLCISRWRSLNRNSYPIFFSGTLIQLNELNSNSKEGGTWMKP